MGYFDGIAAASFKQTASGKTAFYPWGKLGRGYETQDRQQYLKIERSVVRFHMITLPTIIVSVVIAWWLAILIAAASCLAYAIIAGRWTRNLKQTTETLTLAESYGSRADRFGWSLLWSFLAVSLLFVFGGFLILRSGDDRLIGIATMALFGVGVVVFSYMMVLKRRRSRSKASPAQATRE